MLASIPYALHDNDHNDLTVLADHSELNNMQLIALNIYIYI